MQDCPEGDGVVSATCRCTGETPPEGLQPKQRQVLLRTKPPTAPCPQWDNAFSYDPAQWKCETRPFDNDPKALAERVGNCDASSVRRYLDHDLLFIGYGWPSGRHHYGQASCNPKGNHPPTDGGVTLHRAALEGANGASPWQWAALTTIHEFIHAGDFPGYDSCAPWLTVDGIPDKERPVLRARHQRGRLRDVDPRTGQRRIRGHVRGQVAGEP